MIPVHNVGSIGIVKDIPSHQLPPEAWSDGANMRFYAGNAFRSLGHTQVFGTPSVVPGFIFNVPTTNSVFWLYASKAAVYGYDAGVHTDITRAAGATPYTAAEYRDWNGCLLGGVPVLNNFADVPQYWPTLSLATDLAALPNWTATLRAKVLRNFGKFLVALNLNDNGTLLPHAVQWSSQADPGSVPASWDYTSATVDTGRTHLTDVKGGDILDAMLFGSYLIIYKRNSTHLMRFIGGNDIMGFDLMTLVGLLAPRCMCSIDGGKRHFCVSDGDIWTHAGTKDSVDYPIEEKDKQYLFNDLDSTNYLNSFAFENPAYKEAWFAYPSSGQTYPNKALVWNYARNRVMFRDFLGLAVDLGLYSDVLGTTWTTVTGTWDSQTAAWANQGRNRIIVASPSDTKIYGLDNGYAFGTATTTAFLQRTGLAVIGKDRQGNPKMDYDNNRLVKRVWPKIRGNAVVSVRVGGQNSIDGALTWATAKTFNPTQKYLDFEVNTVLPAIEFSSQSDAAWQLEGYDIEIEPLGGAMGTS